MTTTIRIRNVPEGLHRRLKARAALEGVSMSRFVLREIERAPKRPARPGEGRRGVRQSGIAMLLTTPKVSSMTSRERNFTPSSVRVTMSS